MLSQKNMYKYILKCIIVGEPSVGKSCIMEQFVHRKFMDTHHMTIGVDFSSKIININTIHPENKQFHEESEITEPIKLQIWDSSGQEHFMSLTSSYFKNASIAFIVYDISNKRSFYKIKKWIREVKEKTEINTLIVLVGNKNDLSLDREVTYEEGKNLADRRGYIFVELSAKNIDEIDNLFKIAAEYVYHNLSPEEYNINDVMYTISLEDSEKNKDEKRRCCWYM